MTIRYNNLTSIEASRCLIDRIGAYSWALSEECEVEKGRSNETHIFHVDEIQLGKVEKGQLIEDRTDIKSPPFHPIDFLCSVQSNLHLREIPTSRITYQTRAQLNTCQNNKKCFKLVSLREILLVVDGHFV